MGQDIEVDGLTFTFPDAWRVSKYDEWSFYRQRWSRMRNEIKAVDLLLWEPNGTAWFVEVKDYRRNPRTKKLDLIEEVVRKVFDTLAALLPAAVNGDEQSEKSMAAAILRAKKLRVVLHLEQPVKPSKLFSRAFDRAKYSFAAAILNRLVSAVDTQILHRRLMKDGQARLDEGTRLLADATSDGGARLLLLRRF